MALEIFMWTMHFCELNRLKNMSHTLKLIVAKKEKSVYHVRSLGEILRNGIAE